MELKRFSASTSPIRAWLAADTAGLRFLPTYVSDQWEHLVDFERRFLWLAEQDGKGVGFFDFDVDPSGAGYFVFYIAPEFRGRGLGRELLRLGLQTSEASRCAYVEGGVEKENAASRHVLEAEGFTCVGPDEDGMLMYRRRV